MSEELISKLLIKCLNNKLCFDFSNTVGSIDVLKFDEGKLIKVSHGYVSGWEHEAPLDVLTRMHEEVDEFIEEENINESVTESIQSAI